MPSDPKSKYESEANRFMPDLVLQNGNHLARYLEHTLEAHVIGIGERIGSIMTFKDPDENSLAHVMDRVKQIDGEDQPSTSPSRRRYDKVCSVIATEGTRLVLVVKYKAAHKPSSALLLDFEPGLSFELDEIIDRHKMAAQENERRREIAEEVMAVIITQTFDYTIDQGMSYGYVTGGNIKL